VASVRGVLRDGSVAQPLRAKHARRCIGGAEGLCARSWEAVRSMV